MHPLEKHLFKTLAEYDASALPHKAADGTNGYTINLSIQDAPISRIVAYRIVDTLHASKLLKGNIADVRISELNNTNEPMALADNAAIVPNADAQGNLMLRMYFENSSPLEIHRKIANLYSALQKIDERPSALQASEAAIHSTFNAAGLPVDTVQAVHNDSVVTFKKGDLPVERQRETLQAMYDANLFKVDDVKTSPLAGLRNNGAIMWYLPFPDKSAKQVQEGFFQAEMLLRQRDQSKQPWLERINKSTFVSGEGAGRQ